MVGKRSWSDSIGMKITYWLIAILVLIYLFVQDLVGLFPGGEVVNYLVRSFYHGNLLHLLLNLFSLYSLGNDLEPMMGGGVYLGMIIFLWLVSSLLLLGIDQVFDQKKISVGFSAVLFGMALVEAFEEQNGALSLVNLLAVGRLVSVFQTMVFKLLPQLLIPGISFEGHLSGLVAGLIYLLVT